MNPFSDLSLLFGDMHNHCGISYAHGSLEDALSNAREQLDFVSITGHAHWPDMPEPNDDIQYIIDFHEEGFAKLKAGWPKMMETLKQFNDEGNFVVFPGFEVHFGTCGDRNMLYKDLEGDILYPRNLEALHNQLRALREQGGMSLLSRTTLAISKARVASIGTASVPSLLPSLKCFRCTAVLNRRRILSRSCIPWGQAIGRVQFIMV